MSFLFVPYSQKGGERMAKAEQSDYCKWPDLWKQLGGFFGKKY